MNPVEFLKSKAVPGDYLDLELLAALREASLAESNSLIHELTELFTKTTPPILQQLRSAVDSGEVIVASKLAHRLKGSSINIGAKHMSALCAQLEKSAQTNAAALTRELVEQIAASFTASVQALRNYESTSGRN